MAVFMTDEQMLHLLLGIREIMVDFGDRGYLPAMDELIAALRRRIEWEERK